MKSKVSLEDFNQVDLGDSQKNLGWGSTGNVRLVRYKDKPKLYAMKTINKRKLPRQEMKEQIKTELGIQRKLKRNNIIRLYHYFEDDDNVYLILEYAPKGNLLEYIQNNERLTEREAFYFFFQTILAIDYLHKNDIWHRDLKPENLLLDRECNIKVCDFGWAAKLKKQDYRQPPPFHSNIQRSTFVGTTDYMSPEMINYQDYNHNIDIWAIGILLYELLHGQPPFQSKNNFQKVIKIKYFESVKKCIKIGHFVSEEARDLLDKILQKDMNNRISFEGIFKHPWIVKHAIKWNINIQEQIYHKTNQTKSQQIPILNNNSQKNVQNLSSNKKPGFIKQTDSQIIKQLNQSSKISHTPSINEFTNNIVKQLHSQNRLLSTNIQLRKTEQHNQLNIPLHQQNNHFQHNKNLFPIIQYSQNVKSLQEPNRWLSSTNLDESYEIQEPGIQITPHTKRKNRYSPKKNESRSSSSIFQSDSFEKGPTDDILSSEVQNKRNEQENQLHIKNAKEQQIQKRTQYDQLFSFTPSILDQNLIQTKQTRKGLFAPLFQQYPISVPNQNINKKPNNNSKSQKNNYWQNVENENINPQQSFSKPIWNLQSKHLTLVKKKIPQNEADQNIQQWDPNLEEETFQSSTSTMELEEEDNSQSQKLNRFNFNLQRTKMMETLNEKGFYSNEIFIGDQKSNKLSLLSLNFQLYIFQQKL